MTLVRIVALTLLVGGLTALAPSAGAAEPVILTVTAPAAREGTTTRVTLRASTGQGALPDVPLTIERSSAAGWQPVADVTTAADGAASTEVELDRDPAANRLRVSYAGDTTYDAAVVVQQLRLVKRDGRLRLRGPAKVVDETSVTLTGRWTAGGDPVDGIVRLQRKDGKRWRTVAKAVTGRDGNAPFEVAPREDSRWRVVARALPWVAGAHSRVHRLDNVPPGVPVRLPKGAPRPRRSLPPQPHAVGAGPHAVITGIPNRVWRDMTGRSWHAGCPVGRPGLRLLRINYWDYDGYRRRGELVAAAGAVGAMAGALAEMYRRRLPIRSMYRVDRFGWSPRLHGADDYASMAAGNTSAFNCREVVGRPGVRSPHAYGRALDVNTWENPYRSPQGLYPNAWWQGHSHPRVAWRSGAHPVVRLMAAHGLRWTYGLGDTQHFDAAVHGRVLPVPECRDVVCD